MKRFFKKIRVSHKVTPIIVEPVNKKRTYKLSPNQIIAKKIAGEICGLQVYEKKAVEYIKGDNIKKARKFLKIRLGSLTRAEKKLEVLMKRAN